VWKKRYCPCLYAQSKSESKSKSSEGVISELLEAAAPVIASVGTGIVKDMLGLCKPNSVQALQPVMQRWPDMVHGHGLSDVVGLGIKQDNNLMSAKKMMGSEPNDEVLTEYINHWGLLGTWKIDDADAEAKQIFAISVHPLNVAYEGKLDFATKNYPVLHNTYLSFVTQCFDFWRGNMDYKIQFVCSGFHSARVRIYWSPTEIPTTAPTLIDSSNYINEIVDIVSDSEMEITVPYLNDRPFLPNVIKDSNGFLCMQLLNPIAFPAEKVPSIYVNVWVRGGKNMQFFKPTVMRLNQKWYYKASASANPAADWMTYDSKRVVPKSEAEINAPLYAQGSFFKLGHDAPQFLGTNSGEEITSIGELVRRPGFFCRSYMPMVGAQDDTLEDNVRALIVDPLATFFTDWKSANAVEKKRFHIKQVLSNYSFMRHFRRGFRYSRGSVNMQALPGSSENGKYGWTEAKVTLMTDDLGSTGSDYDTSVLPVNDAFFDRLWGSGMTYFGNSTRYPVSVNTPYYCSMPFNTWSEGTLGLYSVNGVHVKTIFQFHNDEIKKSADQIRGLVMMYESAGDDFELGYPIAPPSQLYIPGLWFNVKDYYKLFTFTSDTPIFTAT
jgi:hypothetical protein